MTRDDWKHAKNLMKILEQGEQEIPNSLVEIVSRYEEILVERYTLHIVVENKQFIFYFHILRQEEGGIKKYDGIFDPDGNGDEDDDDDMDGFVF
jgi:hypothetical protein